MQHNVTNSPFFSREGLFVQQEGLFFGEQLLLQGKVPSFGRGRFFLVPVSSPSGAQELSGGPFLISGIFY